jgi:hypothetical protein
MMTVSLGLLCVRNTECHSEKNIEEEERQQSCQFRAHGNVRLFLFRAHADRALFSFQGARRPCAFFFSGRTQTVRFFIFRLL